MRHLVYALAARADTRIRLWAPPGQVPDNVELVTRADDRRWLGELLAQGGVAHALRTRGLNGVLAAVGLLLRLRRCFRDQSARTDLFHINWLQNALPLPRSRKPLLVTALGTDMQLLKLPLMKPLLRRVFRARPTTICPNAEWMVTPLERAFGSVATIRYLPFGIDPSWFGVTRGTRIGPARWLVVSRLTRAKLGALFEQGRPHFSGPHRQLHLVGPMQEQIDVPDWVHYHGAASAQELLTQWFPAVAGLITLSEHAEGRPQVMLEAMAAGLPIIASNISAHADLLVHGHTGWLCDSPQDLALGIQTLERAGDNERIGAAARDWVRAHVGTWADCAERYQGVYRALLLESNSR